MFRLSCEQIPRCFLESWQVSGHGRHESVHRLLRLTNPIPVSINASRLLDELAKRYRGSKMTSRATTPSLGRPGPRGMLLSDSNGVVAVSMLAPGLSNLFRTAQSQISSIILTYQLIIVSQWLAIARFRVSVGSYNEISVESVPMPIGSESCHEIHAGH